MKKSILLASLMASFAIIPTVASSLGSNASILSPGKECSTLCPNDNFATIEFDTLRIDLGKFPASSPKRSCTFTFTNTGTAPLVIHQAIASCGCTVPSYSNHPIKPGEKGQIDVSYNGAGKFKGHFLKTIAVRSNATNQVVRLVIEGEMTDD